MVERSWMAMKTDLVTIAIIFSFSLEACTTPYVLTTVPQQTPYWQTQNLSYDELMAKAKGEIVTVVTEDGYERRGILFQANPEFIEWADDETGTIWKVPTPTVRRVELSHNFLWEGGAVGFLLGTVPLIWAGWWAASQVSGHQDSVESSGRIVVVLGGITGAVFGFVIGNWVKHTDEFQVHPVEGERTTRSDSTK